VLISHTGAPDGLVDRTVTLDAGAAIGSLRTGT
jgi:hypothetical protein